jgi:tripartite-type tricarboxylate transporter receptor subunit TctC
MKRLLAFALASALALAIASATTLPAAAQNYPEKPIHIIVPFTPGSATDVTARAIAAVMTKNLGQSVIVENKPGAGGTIGAGQVAKAAPDGYTLLANSSAHTVNPAIYANMTFDTVKDLPGVTLLAVQPNIMVASPSKGWKTATDYVKAAKAQPGKLTYATAGTGSGTHMNAEKFKLAAGIDTVHVPYKGTPEALGDTMNGRTDIYFCPVIAALPMIKDNRVVALANGSPKRSSVLPDLATTEEQGFKDSGYNFWVGLFAPAGTPPALISKINAEVKKALDSPEVKERLQALGTDPAPTTPAELDKIVATEVKENIDLAKKANIKLQ